MTAQTTGCWEREVRSRCCHRLLKGVLRTRFIDAGCGLKAITQQTARKRLPRLEDAGFFFDTKLLVWAGRLAPRSRYRLGGGRVAVDGYHILRGLDAPVNDVDNLTRLSGETFRAQLYAGPSDGQLRPCEMLWPFETGFQAGCLFPVLVNVPNVIPGSNAWVQPRAGEAGAGASYEEARAVGGRFGRSRVLCVPTDPDPNVCHYLTGRESFRLEPGLPQFNVGRLEPGGTRTDGTREWRLIGQAGFRYFVEKSLDDFRWRPLLQVSNVTGTVIFVDPTPGEGSAEFYRSRILD